MFKRIITTTATAILLLFINVSDVGDVSLKTANASIYSDCLFDWSVLNDCGGQQKFPNMPISSQYSEREFLCEQQYAEDLDECKTEREYWNTFAATGCAGLGFAIGTGGGLPGFVIGTIVATNCASAFYEKNKEDEKECQYQSVLKKADCRRES